VKPGNEVVFTELEVDSLGYDPREGLTCTSLFTDTDYNAQHFDIMISLYDFTGNKSVIQASPFLYVKDIQVPTANDDNYEITVDHDLESPNSILENDLDPNGNSSDLELRLISGVSHGELRLKKDGYFNYSPEEGYVGTDHFTYAVQNELYTSSPATVTLEMTPETLESRLSQEPSVRIFPNPAREKIHIGLFLTRKNDVEIIVYSLNGMRIADIYSGSLTAGSHMLHWNTPHVSSSDVGPRIYLINIRSDELSTTMKVIAE
jgi:hypothetical protein